MMPKAPSTNIHDYPKPSLTVDIIVFTIVNGELRVLLVKRNLPPFKEKWAIPGGFVRIKEALEDAAKRELAEETSVKKAYLEQLYTFGNVKRDPRGRVVTVTYMALISPDTKIKASSDASEAGWHKITSLPLLAFDHANIVAYAIKRLRWKFEYTTIAFSLLPNKFTLSNLQNLYESVFNEKFDKRNFRKKILSLSILNKEGKLENTLHRPPELYSLKRKIDKIVKILN